MPSPLSRTMTHAGLPLLLCIPWPVRAARRSRSPENLGLLPRSVSKKGQMPTFCYESMAFAVSGIVVFTLQTLWLWTRHSKSMRENEVTMNGSWYNWVDTERQHWGSFPRGLWILFILGWTPSFMCLESPCCLWCHRLADWLEASLFEEYDSRMSQSVNPFGSVLRGRYNLELGLETRQVPSIMYTSPFYFQ